MLGAYVKVLVPADRRLVNALTSLFAPAMTSMAIPLSLVAIA